MPEFRKRNILAHQFKDTLLPNMSFDIGGAYFRDENDNQVYVSEGDWLIETKKFANEVELWTSRRYLVSTYILLPDEIFKSLYEQV